MGKISFVRVNCLTTVQDLGRVGHRKIGVAQGGAVDLHAARVANLILGNEENAALLEIGLGRVEIQFHDSRMIAWCGGEFLVRMGNATVPPGHASAVVANEIVKIEPGNRGCRMWLALSGGIDVPVILDSRATDLRGGFGGLQGRSLGEGDELNLAETSIPPGQRTVAWGAPNELTRTAAEENILTVVRGAEFEQFSTNAQRAFFQEPFVVSPRSDRMGVRLRGLSLDRTRKTELFSEAVVPGTVQIANDGQPLLLLGDCQTIGGYPKIAHVITVDLSRAAQLRPNDAVRFREVSAVEARSLYLARERDLAWFRAGLRLHTS